jgi:hypothetical protein
MLDYQTLGQGCYNRHAGQKWMRRGQSCEEMTRKYTSLRDLLFSLL